MRRLPDAHWLALLAITETDFPAEYPWLMQVVLNRTRSQRFPNDVYNAVRQNRQFSYFNEFQSIADEPELFRQVRNAKLRDVAPAAAEALESRARICAGAMLELPVECPILPPTVLNYWSPRSMLPRGALPPWNWRALHCFAAPGVAPWRFVFAESVPAGDKRAGNGPKFDMRSPPGVTA